MHIGFIGLGLMGRPMALHLARAGASLAPVGTPGSLTSPLSLQARL